MDAVWLGALAFLVMFGFDLVSMAQQVILKRAIPLVAGGLFLAAIYQIVRQPPAMTLPAWVTAFGILLSLSGAFLLAYSLVIEIPFQSTYLAPGAPSRLITTGTYALTRHPGVLWLAVFLAGILLANRSLALLSAAPVWLGLDILYVWLQDRYFFPKQFPDYGDYRRQTPMLIPTRESLARCLYTLPWRHHRSP